MRTVIINNREGLEQLQMPPVGKDSGGKPMIGECVTLLPGANLVDSAKLKVLLKNEAIARKFKTKIPPSAAPEQNPERVGKFVLEVDKAVGKDGELPDSDPLKDLTDAQCRSLIEETLVPSMLKEWLEEEGRGEVRKMIHQQLRILTESPANAATAGR